MSTSRVGRKPVVIPSGVEVKIKDQELTVKGPKGSLTCKIDPYVQVTLDKDQLKVSLNQNLKKSHVTGANKKTLAAIFGTTQATLRNNVQGVTKGFERRLEMKGVGYKAQAKGKVLSLSLGFSHPTDYSVPEGITIETPTPTEIIIKGINKQIVGAAAAEIRKYRPPEPYKGKGVRHLGEHVEIKETKKK